MPPPSTPYSSDYWLYNYLYNPLASHLCFIHPNWITFAALLLTIPVVLGLLHHNSLWALVALFLLRAALDCMDGAVARSCGSTSEWGALFDKISDNIFLTAVLTALIYCTILKYGIDSWKTAAIAITTAILIIYVTNDAYSVHQGGIEDATPIIILLHDNYTLFNGVAGAVVWWLANQF
jgi:phosphatidylglycerophosphate synthase